MKQASETMSHLLKPSAVAVDTLEQLFVKANNDLSYVQHKLEKEFDGTHADNVNPLKLMWRIKRIQEELPSLEGECRKLLAAKQDLIDKTKRILVANRASLRRLQARLDIPICCDTDDPVYSSFMNVLKEWNNQLDLPPGQDTYGNGLIALEQLNQELFSSKIQDV